MPENQNPAAEDSENRKPSEGEFKPVPDEAGPHDVPDSEVIESTLPANVK